MIDPGEAEPLRARRLLARYGDGLLFDLLDHKEADLRREGQPPLTPISQRLERFRAVVRQQQRNPHRLADLAVNGDDLIELGYRPGPAIGRDAAARSSHEVVDEPELNTRDELLAGRRSSQVIRWERARLRRRLHHTRGRREQRRLRVAQPHGRHRRRARRRRGEPPHRLCRARPRRRRALAFNRQVHSPTVHRAQAGQARRARRRALERRARAAVACDVAADCLPIAIARRDRRRARSQCCTPAGAASREGVVAAGVAGARRRARRRRWSDPSIGPVLLRGRRPEVSELFDADLTVDGKLDLWGAAERALRCCRRRDRRARRSLHAVPSRSSSSRIGAADRCVAFRG